MHHDENTEWYDSIRALVAEGFEVGWSYYGHPTPEQKQQALFRMLECFGSRADAWLLPPTLRYQHIEAASTFSDPDGHLGVPMSCRWAVHGILKDKPEKGHVPENVRLPTWEQHVQEFRESKPLADYALGLG